MDLVLVDTVLLETLAALGPVLLYSGIPVLAAMLGSLLASRFQLGPHGRSHLQHLAAGIIFSVVAVEILPDVIHRQHPMLLTMGFSSGVAFMLWLETLSGTSTPSEENHASSTGLPWSLIAGVGIDVFLDGLLIAITFHQTAGTGRLLSLALSVELLSVGLTLASTLKNHNLPAPSIFLINLTTFSLIAVGSVVGVIVLPLLPDTAIDLILSFGLAALLFLVTEELLVEAHREVDTHLSTLLFFAGFLAFLLLGQNHG